MKKNVRIFSFILACCCLFCIMPFSAFAEEQQTDPIPDPIKDVYVYDGVTYFNVNSAYAETSPRRFIEDCLTATNSNYLDVSAVNLKAGESTANLWQYLGLEIQRQLGSGTDTEKFRTQFNDVLLNYATNYSYGSTVNLSSGDNTYDVTSTGLQSADSVANAGAEIEKKIYYWYTHADGTRDMTTSKESSSAVWPNSTLSGNTNEQDVFWTLIAANKTSGKNKQGHYQALAVVFSDFTLSPIVPELSGNNYVTYSDNKPTTEPGLTNGVRNDTSSTVTVTQGLRNEESWEVISEVNGSRQYDFGQAIGATVNIGRDTALVNVSASIELTFSQSIQNGWSKTDAHITTKDLSFNVTPNVPAYTQVVLSTKETTWTTTSKYNCPVALGFKVTVVEYTLDPSSNSAEAKTQVLATYSNARENLNQYAVVEQSVVSRDKMNWSSASGTVKAVASKLSATAPMSSTGASLEATYKVFASEIGGTVPLYPLTSVVAEDNEGRKLREITLSPGESVCVDDIVLRGYNAMPGEVSGTNGTYYGFKSCKDENHKDYWILVNDQNQSIGNGTSESAAILEPDTIMGVTYLKGQSAGTVYLKYVINEDCYGTVNASDGFATNESISTATIKVVVANRLTSGTPYIQEQTDTPSVTVTRDTMIEKIRGLDLASEFIDPEKGSVVSYFLYKNEDAELSEGEHIYQGLVDDLEAGTYYVRANVGNKFSRVATVILEEEKLSALYIPNEYGVDQGEELDLNDFTLYGYDQNSEPIGVSGAEWYLEGSSQPIANGVLLAESAGTLSVYAVSDGVKSNVMTVTVSAKENDQDTSPDDETGPSDDKNNPSDNPPQPDDNSHMMLWIALLFIIGGAVIALTVVDRKRRRASKK